MGYFVRLVLIAVVVWAAVRLVGYLIHNNRTKQPSGSARMLPCSHCGVYVPEPNALWDGEKAFCSKEHRNAK
jgi:uncharacterized protein